MPAAACTCAANLTQQCQQQQQQQALLYADVGAKLSAASIAGARVCAWMLL
jgi:hypothetical protein